MASAYFEGPTLAAWLRDRHKSVAPRLAAQILAPLADAMHHAHGPGILHRDLKLWEVATGRSRWEKLAHEGDAVITRFTRDGRRILTCGRKDGLLRIRDRASAIMLDALPGNGHILESAVFSPDGSMLATAVGNGVKFWNPSGRALVAAMPAAGWAQGVAFSHDGRMLAVAHEGSEMARRWDVSSRRLRRELPGQALSDPVRAFLWPTIEDESTAVAPREGRSENSRS
jgi:WD40 repeat protein